MEGSEQIARNLTIIFKRMRNYRSGGRRASGLDLTLTEHSPLLSAQHGRCNICLYKFRNDLDFYAPEEDELAIAAEEPAPNEIALFPLYRTPELDHIIPVILGGDSSSNWQILCRSCNRGKGASLGAHLRGDQFAFSRLDELTSMTAAKRYAVIAAARRHTDQSSCEHDSEHLRVFKLDASGLLVMHNLFAKVA